MSVIYTLGDRVLIAGMDSRVGRGNLSALYSDAGPRPINLRLQECVVAGVQAGTTAQEDSPSTDAVIFLQYIGDDGALRTMDYSPYVLQDRRFLSRLVRNIAAFGLTDEQVEFIKHYVIPRPVATTGYVHMLTDLVSMMRAALERPNLPVFSTADKEAVFDRARGLNITTVPYPTYRFISTVAQEPDYEILNADAPELPTPVTRRSVRAVYDELTIAEVSTNPTVAWSDPVWQTTATQNDPAAPTLQMTPMETAPEPSEDSEEDGYPEPSSEEDGYDEDSDDDSWMDDDNDVGATSEDE